MNTKTMNTTEHASENRITGAETVDQPLKSRNPRKAKLVWLVGLLALNLAVAAVALNYLLPDPPARSQGITARADWYFLHGQLQADARTLAATIRYMVEAEPKPSDVATLAFTRLPDGGIPNSKALVLTPDTAPRRLVDGVESVQSETGESL